MSTGKKIRSKIWIIYLVIFIGFSLYITFSDYGLLKFMKLKNEISELQQEINFTEKRLNELDQEIDSLKTNLVKIEKVARIRYYMLRENEKAFKIEEK